jgi:NAD(P)-dependent dehydrogenase (short-subunit alcohol dehydrogenase family)
MADEQHPSLKGKTALVTGAGRGLGQAIALALARAGAHVVVVDVNPDAAQRTADSIALANGSASVHTVDVSNKIAMQTMLYAVLDEHPPIVILVNAAHITPHTSAYKMDEGEWDRTLDVNLKGAFLISQTAARAMKETGGGLILNVVRPTSSTHAAVRAAREGLLGLTAACAAEWAEFGVRVEALHATDPVVTAAEAVRLCALIPNP